MDPEPAAIKELISKALEECEDLSLLDLVYKLIVSENIEGQSPQALSPFFNYLEGVQFTVFVNSTSSLIS